MKETQYFRNPQLRHIRSWQRLVTMALEKGYQKRLDDRTVPAIVHCIMAYCKMQRINFDRWGDSGVIIRGTLVEVLASHRTAPEPSQYKSDGKLIHVPVYSLADFFDLMDENTLDNDL